MRKFKLIRKNGKSATCQNLRLFGEILVDQNGNKKFLFDFDECLELLKQADATKAKPPRLIKTKYGKSNATELRLDVKINWGKMQIDFSKKNFL